MTAIEWVSALFLFNLVLLFVFFFITMPTILWKQITSSLLMLFLSVSILFGSAVLLGKPRLAEFDLISIQGTVAAYYFIEDEAIWLWLLLEGQEAPAYIQLPWSDEKAAELEEAFKNRGEQQGGEVKIKTGDEHSEGIFTFEAPPTITKD